MKKLLGKRPAATFKFFFLVCALCVLTVFTFFADAAEIYRWTDDDGIIHVTDDRSQIPAKYWEQGRVTREAVKPSTTEKSPAKPVQPVEAPKGETSELYGDYPIDWWIYKFRDLRKNISDSQERLDRENNFITVYEGGRGFGKIFSQEEINRYENYKSDIPVTEEKLKSLKGELEELQRKARIYGVPKNITE